MAETPTDYRCENCRAPLDNEYADLCRVCADKNNQLIADFAAGLRCVMCGHALNATDSTSDALSRSGRPAGTPSAETADRAAPTNLHAEPDYPGAETVLMALSNPMLTAHQPTERCAIEVPHRIEACDEFASKPAESPAVNDVLGAIARDYPGGAALISRHIRQLRTALAASREQAAKALADTLRVLEDTRARWANTRVELAASRDRIAELEDENTTLDALGQQAIRDRDAARESRSVDGRKSTKRGLLSNDREKDADT